MAIESTYVLVKHILADSDKKEALQVEKKSPKKPSIFPKITIPKKDYANKENTNPANCPTKELPGTKFKSQTTYTIPFEINLMDIDTEEVKQQMASIQEKQKILKRSSKLLKFVLKKKDTLMYPTENLITELESFIKYIKNFNLSSTKNSLPSLNSKTKPELSDCNEYGIDIINMLSRSLSVPCVPVNKSEYLKHEEKKVISWIEGKIVKYKELLELKDTFTFVDLRKVHELYLSCPENILYAIKIEEYKKAFSGIMMDSFLLYSGDDTIWNKIPADLPGICKFISNYFIVREIDFCILVRALKAYEIKPCLGITWPYKVVSLESKKKCTYLRKLYFEIRVSKIFKYTVLRENYCSISTSLKYYVK